MNDPAELLPDDAHNRRLRANARPADWVNPRPERRYNLVVVGGGTAGLVAAAGAAGLGAKVALVERNLLGGDCLNVGCVPSKALIRAARAVRQQRDAGEFGVRIPPGVEIDFPAIMRRMRCLRADISPHDSAERFRELGVDVFLGDGAFVDSHTLEVAGQRLAFKKAVIATGTRAAAPAIPGLELVEHLTNETVFSLTELPPRLGVVGAGPIGCELAQTFALFGSQVTLFEATHGILPREDRDAAQIVQDALTQDGVRLLCCGKRIEISRQGEAIQVTLSSHDQPYTVAVDRLLIAAGRTPNVEGLGLDRVGVKFDEQAGVEVDDRLRTTNPHIYAAGDVCSRFKFTHAADFMARLVIRNALFLGRQKFSGLVIPWATYTTPELARVGLSPATAAEQGVAIDTYVQPLADVDRAILDGETSGFVRIHTRRGGDTIVGATIVAPDAGEMIATISLAMTHGLGLNELAATIFPYPTVTEAVRKIGDQYSRTRLTPWVKSALANWLAWTR